MLSRLCRAGIFLAVLGAAVAGRAALPVSISPEPPGTSSLDDDREEAALARVNAILRTDPRNVLAYLVRGNIYGGRGFWRLAREDYGTALQIDPGNVVARVNLAELKFCLKQYDEARVDFAALAANQEIGDLAGYKVFLCDLLAGHEQAAAQELAVFNAAGENASYYFGNVAWDLIHHDILQARDYLTSAAAIYSTKKVALYAASLVQLGYLPLPDAPQGAGPMTLYARR